MAFLAEYNARARCPKCDNILWTTDKLTGVRCPCNLTYINPKSRRSSNVTDAEFERAVRNDNSLPDSETVIIERIK